MTHVTHRELMPGVRLTAVQTDKFKTNLLSVSLLGSHLGRDGLRQRVVPLRAPPGYRALS